ncbi:hypothetical protein AB0K16_22135 [Nonomuraea jabiensis]|uniref:hypothetical protein n=1 Tax=Nonomuraea jabiensis TaxID=882448 RepID=UPI00341A80E5
MNIIESRDITRDDITYRVSLVKDTDADPRNDGDWATQEDINAWLRDDWEYVSVFVTPIIAGTEITEARTSTSAEYGSLPNAEIGMDEILQNDYVISKIREARENLKRVLPDVLARHMDMAVKISELQSKLTS